MLRSIWIIPLSLAIAAFAGLGLCRLFGVNPHPREMILSLGCCLIACEIAIIPVLFLRRASIVTFGQATLVSTVLHLFLILISGVILFLAIRPELAFVYWLIAGYWVSLISLSALLIGAVRTAALPQH